MMNYFTVPNLLFMGSKWKLQVVQQTITAYPHYQRVKSTASTYFYSNATAIEPLSYDEYFEYAANCISFLRNPFYARLHTALLGYQSSIYNYSLGEEMICSYLENLPESCIDLVSSIIEILIDTDSSFVELEHLQDNYSLQHRFYGDKAESTFNFLECEGILICTSHENISCRYFMF